MPLGFLSGMVEVWDASLRTRVIRLGFDDGIDDVSLSPDGTHLALVTKQGVTFWDVSTAREVAGIDDPNAFVSSLAYSPQGNRFAAIDQNKSVWIYDRVTGRKLHKVVHDYTSLGFAPGEARLRWKFPGRIQLIGSSILPHPLPFLGRSPKAISFEIFDKSPLNAFELSCERLTLINGSREVDLNESLACTGISISESICDADYDPPLPWRMVPNATELQPPELGAIAGLRRLLDGLSH